MSIRTVMVSAAVVTVTLTPGVVAAQAPAEPPPAPFTAGWQDGFVLQSSNGDYTC